MTQIKDTIAEDDQREFIKFNAAVQQALNGTSKTTVPTPAAETSVTMKSLQDDARRFFERYQAERNRAWEQAVADASAQNQDRSAQALVNKEGDTPKLPKTNASSSFCAPTTKQNNKRRAAIAAAPSVSPYDAAPAPGNGGGASGSSSSVGGGGGGSYLKDWQTASDTCAAKRAASSGGYI